MMLRRTTIALLFGSAYLADADTEGIETVRGVRDQQTAQCVFDLLHGMTFLAQAGTSIDAATRKCQDQSSDPKKAMCSVSVTNIVTTVFNAASFLTATAVDCTHIANWKAACAANCEALLGAAGDMSIAGSAMSGDCPGGKNYRRLLEERKEMNKTFLPMDTGFTDEEARARFAVLMEEAKNQPHPPGMEEPDIADGPEFDNEGRRLWLPVWSRGKPTPKWKTRDYNNELAYCGIFAAQATWFLARAGLNINLAVGDCPYITDASSTFKRVSCGGDVSGIIAAFLNVASFISGAVAQCQHGINAPAACFADATKLVAAMSVTAQQGQNIYLSCDLQLTDDSLGRRLQTNTTKTTEQSQIIV